MNEAIQSTIEAITSQPDDFFQNVLRFFVIYLIILWVAFSLWVFTDAKKRYKNIVVAALVALFVLVFNFPALVLYFVVRPEDPLFMEDSSYYSVGGVDVPLVKFVGDKGEVKMSLNLHITSELHKQADMSLDLGISGERADFSIGQSKKVETQKETSVENSPRKLSDHVSEKDANIVKKTKGRVSKSLKEAAKSAKKIGKKLPKRGSKKK